MKILRALIFLAACGATQAAFARDEKGKVTMNKGAKHTTTVTTNADNSKHISRHSYQIPGGQANVRRSYDRAQDGTKSNDHVVDQTSKGKIKYQVPLPDKKK